MVGNGTQVGWYSRIWNGERHVMYLGLALGVLFERERKEALITTEDKKEVQVEEKNRTRERAWDMGRACDLRIPASSWRHRSIGSRSR